MAISYYVLSSEMLVPTLVTSVNTVSLSMKRKWGKRKGIGEKIPRKKMGIS